MGHAQFTALYLDNGKGKILDGQGSNSGNDLKVWQRPEEPSRITQSISQYRVIAPTSTEVDDSCGKSGMVGKQAR